MDYKNNIADHRRLTILQMLNDQADASLNTDVLLDGLSEVGFGIHKAVLSEDIKLLEALCAVVTKDIRGGMTIVSIDPHGEKICKGQIRVDGVKFPGRMG